MKAVTTTATATVSPLSAEQSTSSKTSSMLNSTPSPAPTAPSTGDTTHYMPTVEDSVLFIRAAAMQARISHERNRPILWVFWCAFSSRWPTESCWEATVSDLVEQRQLDAWLELFLVNNQLSERSTRRELIAIIVTCIAAKTLPIGRVGYGRRSRRGRRS